jgi:hypothetical protein
MQLQVFPVSVKPDGFFGTDPACYIGGYDQHCNSYYHGSGVEHQDMDQIQVDRHCGYKIGCLVKFDCPGIFLKKTDTYACNICPRIIPWLSGKLTGKEKFCAILSFPAPGLSVSRSCWYVPV